MYHLLILGSLKFILNSEMSVEELTRELERVKEENRSLRNKLADKKAEAIEMEPSNGYPLSLDEYSRYGRQLIVPEFQGVQGQVNLKNSKVLVIGAGGLGCPALLYLCAAGVGKIGIVDNDYVDKSNLHRQVLHTTNRVGMLKCESARVYLENLNPNTEIETFPIRLDNDNVFEVMSGYEYVLDCTDTPQTRYLINDGAVLCGLTIVSGSGLKTEGQLSILNFQNQGPCYRCFYPNPPPPNSVTSCKDGGVIGPAIGMVGIMMAYEAIKLITGYYTMENFSPFLTIYSSYPKQSLRTFKMRGRSEKCAICNGTITRKAIESGEIDYQAFCGTIHYRVMDPENDRISVTKYDELVSTDHSLIDVRPKEQFQICSLPNSINIPIDQLMKKELKDLSQFQRGTPNFFICRYGNDSQSAVEFFRTLGIPSKDIIGGLNC